MSPEEILAAFYGQVVYKRDEGRLEHAVRRRSHARREAARTT